MHRNQIDPKISVSIVFVAAMFMSIMDSTIVNVALPSLGHQLGVSNVSIDAVVVSYLVSLAVVIPASGWLGDSFGTKLIFLGSLALFVVASALCGIAQSFPMLVVFRSLQGLAGGALTPTGTALLFRTFPPEQRVQVSRVLIIPTVIAPAVGPVLGGFLVDQLSWRWVFYVNVPIGIAAFIFGLIFLHEYKEPNTGRFDLAGFLLAGISLALVMYALSEGPAAGWTSPIILSSLVLGLILLTVFVIVELRISQPMVNLRLFNNRLFRTTNLVSFFSSAGFLAVLFVGPLFLQEARGVDALQSGLTTFPEAIGVVISTQFVARLYPRTGPRMLTALGLTAVSIFMACLCFMGLNTDLWVMRGLMFMMGFGMAYAFLPMQTTAFATISRAATGQASTLYNAERQLGAAFGVAVLSTVLSAVGTVSRSANGTIIPNVTAYHAAFIAAAILALIGASFALAIHNSDAAATMRIPNKPGKKAPDVSVNDLSLSTD
jgi:EmrB/QacA subfamily drug resistance transporter